MAQEGVVEKGLALMRQSATERFELGVRWYQIRYLCMLAATHLQAGGVCLGLSLGPPAKAGVWSKRGAVQLPLVI
jgi:predicted ATPase